MSVKPVTYYMVECDEPGCDIDTAAISYEFSAWSDSGTALDEWISSDGVQTEDGRTFCEKHADAHLCGECREVKHECQCEPEDAS